MKIPPTLSLIIPTRNEKDTIAAMLDILHSELAQISTEIIIVDDSDDETPRIVKNRAKRAQRSSDIRLIHRKKGKARNGGLSSAVCLGLQSATAQYVVVMDADLQHPPEMVRAMLNRAITSNADIVMATRYRDGGGYEGLDGPSRKLISQGLKWIAKILFIEHLKNASDPLGGFFLVRRSILQHVQLRPIGYKISLEILVRCQWQQLEEVPYQFQARVGGASKSDFKQGILVFQHMFRLFHEIPAAARFWKFAIVGMIGAIVNLVLFALALRWHAPVWLAWIGAVEVSLLSNFALYVTHIWKDQPVGGLEGLGRKLGLYQLSAASALAINLGVFSFLSRFNHMLVIDQAIGIACGLVLNYFLAQHVVFGTHDLRNRAYEWWQTINATLKQKQHPAIYTDPIGDSMIRASTFLQQIKQQLHEEPVEETL